MKAVCGSVFRHTSAITLASKRLCLKSHRVSRLPRGLGAATSIRGMAILSGDQLASIFNASSIPDSRIDEPCLEVLQSLPQSDTLLGGVTQAELDISSFPGAKDLDPFEFARDDLQGLAASIRELLGVDHPVLSTVAKYFFEMDGGKKIRPVMVMLMSKAIMRQGASTQECLAEPILPTQRRLAEITEMIHTASLLHDDVIDMADTRRGVGSVNSVFGNKLAVLAGDFLLARASVCLARLRNVEVVELLSTVIEHLVKGEIMQMSAALRNTKATSAAFDTYMNKTYYKTASLMSNSCQAAALLGGVNKDVQEAAFLYGKHIGLAFQLVDDMLDFASTQDALGKPILNDLKQGLATAPVLFASQQHPDLLTLIERKFEAPGDVEQACSHVVDSNGMQLTRNLATGHAQLALDALEVLVDSPERDALAAIAAKVINRKY